MTEPPVINRKCVGCGAERPKRELLRVVRAPDGTISIDVSGRARGRGAYICPNAECARAAMKKKALSRALKHPVEREVYETVKSLCRDARNDDGA